MRDIARIDLCTEAVAKFNDCGVAAVRSASSIVLECQCKSESSFQGFTIIFKCRKEKDEMYGCIENWVTNEDFQQAVKEEYLNERSHYRQSGIHTMRYEKHSFIPRDVSVHGPAVDENGKYVPRLPKDWNETYKGSLPHWAQAKSEWRHQNASDCRRCFICY